jgi:single-strand DNA-binding protein
MSTTASLVGNTTRDVELRYTNTGKAVASFGMAVGSRRKNDAGQWEDGDTSFYDVTCWGTLAENVAESITKGTRVVVSGRLQQRSWEDKEGNKRSKVEVVADAIGPDLLWATCDVNRAERDHAATDPLPRYATGEEPF